MKAILLSAFAAVSIFGMSAMASSSGDVACGHGYGASPSAYCGSGGWTPADATPEVQEPQPEYQRPARQYRRRPVRQYRPVTKYKATRRK